MRTVRVFGGASPTIHVSGMKILAVVSGSYGRRILDNLRAAAPHGWEVAELNASAENPRAARPARLALADLILSLGERPEVAGLIPELGQATGARAAIVPVDRREWLPIAAEEQLRAALGALGLACAVPQPFCSLVESAFLSRGRRVEYADALISEFARYFGKPRFDISVQNERTVYVGLERAAPCGCTVFVAGGLRGVRVEEAAFEAELLHHEYACLASTGIEVDYGDTLKHVSVRLTQEAVSAALEPFKKTLYMKPG